MAGEILQLIDYSILICKASKRHFKEDICHKKRQIKIKIK